MLKPCFANDSAHDDLDARNVDRCYCKPVEAVLHPVACLSNERTHRKTVHQTSRRTLVMQTTPEPAEDGRLCFAEAGMGRKHYGSVFCETALKR